MTASRPSAPALLMCWVAVLGPIAFGCVEPWSASLLQTSIYLLAALCAIRPVSDPLPAYSYLPLAAAASVLAIGLLQLLAPAPGGAPAGPMPFTAHSHATFQELRHWASIAALCWAGPRAMRSHADARAVCWALFLAGLFVAVVGLLQASHDNYMIYGFRPVRPGRTPFGPFYNYNNAASFMTVAALAGAGAALSRFRKWGAASVSERADLAATQGLVLFLLGIIAQAVVKSGSRAGTASFVLAAIGSLLAASRLPRRRSLRWGLFLASVGAAFACGAYVLSHTEILALQTTSRHHSAEYRISMALTGLTMLSDFPVFGVGLGAFRHVFQTYQSPAVLGLVRHVHNDWLELALQVGLVGFTAFCVPLAAFFGNRGRRGLFERDGAPRFLQGGALAACGALVLHSIVDFPFQIPAISTAFFILLAVLSAGPEAPRLQPLQAAPLKIEHRVRAAFFIALAAAAALPFAAFLELSKAASATPESRVYFLQEAYRLERDPAIQYDVAATYLRLTSAAPAAARPLLTRAAVASRRALDAAPFDSSTLLLTSDVLSRLGRFSDSEELARKARMVGFTR